MVHVPHIGMRIIKSALGVLICFAIYYIRGKQGTPLAEIINPYDGSVMETLYAPRKGTLFFMHSDPITYAETGVIKMI